MSYAKWTLRCLKAVPLESFMPSIRAVVLQGSGGVATLETSASPFQLSQVVQRSPPGGALFPLTKGSDTVGHMVPYSRQSVAPAVPLKPPRNFPGEVTMWQLGVFSVPVLVHQATTSQANLLNTLAYMNRIPPGMGTGLITYL